MRKTLLIIFTLILLTVNLFSQKTIKVELQYDIINQKTRLLEVNYLTFEGAVNLSQFGALPLFKCEIDLPNEYFGCELEIVPVEQDTITRIMSDILTDIDLVKIPFQYEIRYNKSKAHIYVLPLTLSKSETEYIRYTKFNIIIDFVPVDNVEISRNSNVSYASESVLSAGKWTKIGITNTGIHKLSYSDIENMGYNPSQIDLNKIGVFGNYSGVLPESNTKLRDDDLQENSIYFSGLDNGTFDSDDYILFYAQAATTWNYNVFTGRFNHTNNIYSDTTYYFFTPDKGTSKTIGKIVGNVLEPTHFVNSFTDYVVHDMDYENLMSTGKEWYGERFMGDTIEREFEFTFPNKKLNETVYINMDMAGKALVHSYYNVYVNDTKIVDSTRIRLISPTLGIYARKSNTTETFITDNDQIKIKIEYLSDDPNAIAWLDFIELNAKRDLIFSGNQMRFCNPGLSSVGNVGEYEIRNTTLNCEVWDVSDIHNPIRVIKDFNNGITKFVVPTDTLKHFTVFNGDEFYNIVSYEDIQNQNLHGISNVNFVIVRPEKFAEEAERLADIHRTQDGLTTICVSPQQLYNEFSSGSQDISAIRDFMRMLYKQGAFGGKRAYLLLFGDASFDYKHRIHSNTNLVPTYESQESLRETGSFVTDDFFGLLNDYEGSNAAGDLDIGIGRFPITTVDQAKTIIDKIENYQRKKSGIMGEWRTKVCFVADDKDNNLHLKQAEGLVEIADTLTNGLGINKIFLDAYNKITVPGGFRYPDVNDKINSQMNKGALIVNYTGHGGLIGWSDELVLDVPMINSFTNFDNLPLIITATCEFSRFDDPEFTSAGEYVFLNDDGGAIALLTTTRLAYAHANYIVNRRIYSNLISCDNEGSVPRLGDLVRLSKIPSDENYLNFALLGDPALTLAYPKYKIHTTKLEKGSDKNADTVNALSVVEVTGEIKNDNNQIVDDFNGYIYPKVYDKASKYTTLANDGNSYPQDFTLYDKVLYDGKVIVDSGKFTFEFRVPKDISYKYGYGKISYYALDTVSFLDAWGAYDEMNIGGIDDNAVVDLTGPNIDLFLNSSTFSSGDVVSSSPVMFSYISDENGVNSTGNGIGRDMVLLIDHDYSNPVILNDNFEMFLNSYKSGMVIFPFENLSPGLHTLTIKAWDLYNNSSEKTVEFIVDDSAEIQLWEVFNYPNPFYDYTIFTFSHNKEGTQIVSNIKIYDINGTFITELINEGESGLKTGESVTWNGKSQNNELVAEGIYIYVVEVRDDFGNLTVQQQKLFRLNK
jgi:peptidase C25-like protein